MRHLPQQAYVWQQLWTDDVGRDVREDARHLDGYRILVDEMSPDGTILSAHVDVGALLSVRIPVIAVLRVDGRRDLPPPAIAAALLMRSAYRFAGYEIDFDAPTARLSAYRQFLQALRPLLPAAAPLSITALPDWLRSSHFGSLTGAVDRVVLQVHATDDPRLGLFDQARMLAAVRRMSRLSRVPFLVALPAYGVRVAFDPAGRLMSVEGERSALAGGSGVELAVGPAEADAARAALEADPPGNLAGIVWFRLPLASDRRSWSREAWHAVLDRALPPARLAARIAPMAGIDERWSIVLADDSVTDAPLPARIVLPGPCTDLDGTGHYRLDADPRHPALVLVTAGLIRGHARLSVGWTRCRWQTAASLEPSRQDRP